MLLALFTSGILSVARADDFDRVVLLPPGWPASVAGSPPSTWYDPDMRYYLCNDGTLPVYYFEPGQGTGKDKWFIFLEGGGGCSGPDDCHDRALSNHERNKMGTGCIDAQTCGDYGVYDTSGSLYGLDPSLGSYTQAGHANLDRVENFDGLFASNGDNPFGQPGNEWNRVWVNYCSSDMYTGDARNGPDGDPAGGNPLAGMMSTMETTMGGPTDGVLNNAFLQYVVGVDGANTGYDPVTGSACNLPGAPVPVAGLPTCSDSDWCAWPDTSVTPAAITTRACGVDAIFFNGHVIVEHLLDTLKNGTSYQTPCDPDDESEDPVLCTVNVPALAEADQVVFGGGSAGAGGAFNNVDFVADTLHSWNEGVDVRGYFDSLWSPGRLAYADEDIDGNGTVDLFGDGETGPELSEWVRGNPADGAILGNLYHAARVDDTCASSHNLLDFVTLTPADYDALTWRVGWDADCTDAHALTWGNFIETPHFWVQNFHDAVLRDNPCNPAGVSWGDDADMMCYGELLEYSGWYMPTMDTTEGWFLGRLQKHVMAGSDMVYDPAVGYGLDADDHVTDGMSLTDLLSNWLGLTTGPTHAVDDREDDDIDLVNSPSDPSGVGSLIDPLAP